MLAEVAIRMGASIHQGGIIHTEDCSENYFTEAIMSAREIYDSIIRQLVPMERLRLATIILDDLTATGDEGLNMRDDWSDEDIADVARFSMSHADNTILAYVSGSGTPPLAN